MEPCWHHCKPIGFDMDDKRRTVLCKLLGHMTQSSAVKLGVIPHWWGCEHSSLFFCPRETERSRLRRLGCIIDGLNVLTEVEVLCPPKTCRIQGKSHVDWKTLICHLLGYQMPINEPWRGNDTFQSPWLGGARTVVPIHVRVHPSSFHVLLRFHCGQTMFWRVLSKSRWMWLISISDTSNQPTAWTRSSSLWTANIERFASMRRVSMTLQQTFWQSLRTTRRRCLLRHVLLLPLFW